jgi:hypothetical protein
MTNEEMIAMARSRRTFQQSWMNQDLIYQARVLAFTARMDGSSSGARYDELADALEAATTNSELTVEWSICYASGQVMDKSMTEKKARAMAGQGGTRLIKRTVGPWEVCE